MRKGIFMILDPILNLLHISMLVHLCKKYKHKLEPVHIFEINTLVDDYLMIFNLALRHFIGGQLGDESLFCKISTIITFASRLSFYLDICWTQIDRFLALYWNIEYKERVTNNKALFIITITKVLNIVLALLVMVVLDPTWFECQSEQNYQCTVYKKNNALYFTFSTTLAMATVLIVSSYSMKLILKIHSEVSPVVNLNHPPVSTNVRTLSKAVESFDILRNDSNPHLFYKTKIKNKMIKKTKIRPEENILLSCVPPSGQIILEKAKIVLVNNLMTFCILMMMLPNCVMDLVVYLEDKVCDENLGFEVPGRITGFISLLSNICIPFFVMKKLSKF